MGLSIVKKFLLISQHPEKGRFLTDEFQIGYGIIGAALLEMSLDDKIDIVDEKVFAKEIRKKDNELLYEISSVIRESKKNRKIKYWISKLSRKSRKYKWLVLNEMANDKLVRIENKRFLGIIPYRRVYLINKSLRIRLIEELRKLVLFRKEINDENIALLGLVEACKMYKVLSTNKDELKRIKKELKEIIKESNIAGALDSTIKEVQAAIIGAIVASSVAASAASH